jgi:hypothetical protein
MAPDDKAIWLAAGIRTPFTPVFYMLARWIGTLDRRSSK